jgi:hypothetical protein
MRLARFVAELYRRNPLLTFIGWLHIVLLLAALAGYATDDRIVMGVNAWQKAIKYMASIALYLWTLSWFSRYIRRPRWLFRTLSIVVAVTMMVESACLLLQAARGTTSHYNVSTDFDAVIYVLAGGMVAINLLVVLIILFLLRKPGMRLQPVYLWSIRLGIIVFLSTGIIGGVMFANNGHTVGAPDGGPGLPFLNWSTVAGDLRVPLGLSVHALQLLPLLGAAIGRSPRVAGNTVKLSALLMAAALYAALIYGTFRQAMAGIPLI